MNLEGQLIFRCGQDKANWYLDRDLAVKVSENPLTIQFTFQPKGPGHIGDSYYLSDKHNRCVVCGTEEDLTRHHIVPRCYRRFFPVRLKRHASYDVMVLCIPCHRTYEESASKLKQRYADKHDIPVAGAGFGGTNPEQNAVRRAAYNLLVYGHLMPPVRIDFFMKQLEEYFKTTEITKAMMEEARDLPYDYNKPRNYHGEVVIAKEVDLDSFCKQWRYHFLTTMKPGFIPEYWQPDRNIDWEERRVS